MGNVTLQMAHRLVTAGIGTKSNLLGAPALARRAGSPLVAAHSPAVSGLSHRLRARRQEGAARLGSAAPRRGRTCDIGHLALS